MDFLDFFGLKEEPFRLTPDPAFFFPSSSHNEGLLLMDYSIDQKEGFLLIIGDPGTGKTTMLKVFLEKWKSRAETAMILTPRLSPEECLISIAEDFKINLGNKSKNEIIKSLRDFVTRKSQEDRRVIIIIDEAQNLPADTLEELRLLSNLETDKDKLIQIILLGQPELESKLMTDKLRQLNQRISTRIYLRHFGYRETMDYIDYRVITAGKKKLQINKKVGKLIHKYSSGTPRLINMIMSRTLMAAFLEENTTILPRHLSHATKSLNHSEIRIKKSYSLAPLAAGIVLILFVVSASAYFYMQQKSTDVAAGFQTSLRDKEAAAPAAVELAASLPDQETSTQASIENVTGSVPADPVPGEEGIGEYIIKDEEEQVLDDNQMPDIKLVSVKVPVANIRLTPSVDSGKIGHTYRHSQFLVLDEFMDSQNAKWYLVPFQGGKGWVSGWLVERVDIMEMFNEDSGLNEAGQVPEADIIYPDVQVKENLHNGLK